MYLVTAPLLLRKLFPSSLLWEKPAIPNAAKVYLTFDDGPHPQATPFVLDLLAQYQAKATFFCIGKNVIEEPKIYERILAEGHTVGNHPHNHIKGRNTNNNTYIQNVEQAQLYINSKLFRPPYGSIKHRQVTALEQQGFTIVMWSVLSGDFDTSLSLERCLENVLFNIEPGSIVVFHDSAKAWDRLEYVLPRILEHCTKNKWEMAAL
jgi:peptidoglycan/xylan/chitin deacetylase (PgdA/CDA1 family)